MEDILIKNGHILTMDEERRIIKGGDVRIKGDKIVEVKQEIKERAGKTIDAKGKVVMPGLINTHTHLSMVLFRGVAEDLKLQRWLQDKIWPLEENLESNHVYNGALLGSLEMIKSGTTCFVDQYFFMDRVAEAIEKSGLRASLSYGIIEEGDPEKRKDELEKAEELVKNYEGKADGRIKTMFGPHSTYTCSAHCLKEVRKLADKYEVGITIHLSENEQEVGNVTESQGMRPPKFLDSINFLGPDVLAAHCTKVNEEEIKILRKNDVKPVHNPISNMKLGSGIAPIAEMLSEGLTVSLGTDGAASNNTLDMFEEMKFATLLSKAKREDSTMIPAQKALEMATINGAKAIGLEEKIGSVEEGKKADIITIDLEKPHLTPLHNIESHLVYSCNGADVDSVIVNGRVLMKNRKTTILKENKIMKECQNSSDNLVRKVQ